MVIRRRAYRLASDGDVRMSDANVTADNAAHRKD
jgi:hypothetical protein